MSSEKDIDCCFRGCSKSSIRPDLRIEIYHTEAGSSIFHAHESCFNAGKDPSVQYDKPENHGTIPAETKCVFCGKELPLIGKHPYCFDAGDFSPPHRYWAHNECMKAVLKLDHLINFPY